MAMRFVEWRAPCGGASMQAEQALVLDRGRSHKLLIIPALFDEANKLRHFTVEVMRALDRRGIDSALPDLPGTNESLAALDTQSIESWRAAIDAAAEHFEITHSLALRAGAVLLPAHRPSFAYAPLSGSKQLRAMLRARRIAEREAGREVSLDTLAEKARAQGIALAGWRISSSMFTQLEHAEPRAGPSHCIIEHGQIGAAALWLRAEPDHDRQGAQSLARAIAQTVGGN